MPLREKLSQQTTDMDIAVAGKEIGLHLRSLSSHAILPNPPQGLILGYAAYDEQLLTDAANKLCELLTSKNSPFQLR